MRERIVWVILGDLNRRVIDAPRTVASKMEAGALRRRGASA